MDFEAWLSEQRRSIATLRVAAGDYVARYQKALRSYSATKRLAQSSVGPIVAVTRLGLTRARVQLEGAEYEFAPLWVVGFGLDARRCSPTHVRDADTATTTKGYARAAFRAAAREEFDRLSGIAVAATESEADCDAVLRRLTTDGARELEDALCAVLAATLGSRPGGVELAQAPAPCGCVVCGRAYRAGETGPLYQFESTTICTSCLRPASRAA